MKWRTVALGLVLTLMVGCLYPVGEQVDRAVCDMALHPRDLEPMPLPDSFAPPPPADASPKTSPPGKEGKTDGEKDGEKKEGEKKEGGGTTMPAASGLQIPAELLPGGAVPPLQLGETPEKRRADLTRLFPALPPLGEDFEPGPGPHGVPLTLADLQRLALENSPLIKQRMADVEAARGAAIQAGLPPNPNMGYEGDTAGTTGGAGYQGAFIEQTIRTGNKLQLARAVAALDLRNAELQLREDQYSLATRVRTGYFAVLVARESLKINRALVKFTTDVYQIQLNQLLKGGFAAPYEPMYLRALAMQARASYIQARNTYTSAWKRLAADMGVPGLAPTQLAGRIDIPVPAFEYKSVLSRVLAVNTDVLQAMNTYHQSVLRLQQAKITPIPDVTLRFLLQKDRTGPPFELAHSLVLTLPVPIFDRNQGGIMQAQAQLIRAQEELHRARSELSGNVAEAFARYENGRVLLAYYRDHVLPDLVRVYRGVWDRYQRELPGAAPALPGFAGPPGFNDVVVAQQNLATAVTQYVLNLGQMWQAVVDVAGFMQTDDLFGVKGPTCEVPGIPDLEHHLPGVPCKHPCSPLPGAHQALPNPVWPPADPSLPTGTRSLYPTPAAPEPKKDGVAPLRGKEDQLPEPRKVDPLLLEPPPAVPPRRE